MAVVTPTAKAQFIDAAGAPLAGGLLYTYAAGTTTPQATYTDSTGATANSNPVVLDARGEANIWLGSSTYKFKLCDSTNTELWTVDNISAPTTALSPVLSGNVTIDSDSAGTALTITQTGTGAVLRVQDQLDPDATPFIIDNTGQVGIGTATPANALDIAGGTAQISSAAGVARTTISADATDSIFNASDDRNFTIKTNGVARLTINSTDATSTVPIVLPGSPSSGLQAATKTYVDTTAGGYATPSGAIIAYGASTAPSGWLLCDGSVVSQTTYSSLYAAIGTTWNTTGEGAGNFRLPDFRGAFLRGYDNGTRGIDTTIIYGATTNTSTSITGLSSTATLFVGMSVSGTGIPVGATVATISTTSITISSAATATSPTSSSQTGTLTFSGSNVNATVTGLTSTSGLVVGQGVSGTGIPTGTTIQVINSGTSITLSANPTANGAQTLTFAAVPTALTFTGRAFASYQTDAYQNHSHPVTDIGHQHQVPAPSTVQTGTNGVGANSSTLSGLSTTGLLVGTSTTGGPETRPKNYAVLYIIKT